MKSVKNLLVASSLFAVVVTPAAVHAVTILNDDFESMALHAPLFGRVAPTGQTWRNGTGASSGWGYPQPSDPSSAVSIEWNEFAVSGIRGVGFFSGGGAPLPSAEIPLGQSLNSGGVYTVTTDFVLGSQAERGSIGFRDTVHDNASFVFGAFLDGSLNWDTRAITGATAHTGPAPVTHDAGTWTVINGPNTSGTSLDQIFLHVTMTLDYPNNSLTTTIQDLNGPATDTFAVNLPSGFQPDIFGWRGGASTTAGSTGGTGFDNVNITLVPEPSTLALIGIAALPMLRRRR